MSTMNSEMIKLRVKVVGLVESIRTARNMPTCDNMSVSEYNGVDGDLMRKRRYSRLDHPQETPHSHYFLVIVPAALSISQLKVHVQGRFAKMYPEDGQITIMRLRDAYGCDLDEEFLVAEIFAGEDTVFAVAKKPIASSTTVLHQPAPVNTMIPALITPATTPTVTISEPAPKKSRAAKKAKETPKSPEKATETSAASNNSVQEVAASIVEEPKFVEPAITVSTPVVVEVPKKVPAPRKKKTEAVTQAVDNISVAPAAVPEMIPEIIPTHAAPSAVPAPKAKAPRKTPAAKAKPVDVAAVKASEAQRLETQTPTIDEKLNQELILTMSSSPKEEVPLAPISVAPVKVTDISNVVSAGKAKSADDESSSSEDESEPIPKIPAFKNAAAIPVIQPKTADDSDSSSDDDDLVLPQPQHRPSLTSLNEELRKSASPAPIALQPQATIPQPIKTKAALAANGAAPARKRYVRKNKPEVTPTPPATTTTSTPQKSK